MTSVRSAAVPRWLKITVWSIAIVIALLGVVLALVSNSIWPLIAFAGLAIPMFPITTARTSRKSVTE